MLTVGDLLRDIDVRLLAGERGVLTEAAQRMHVRSGTGHFAVRPGV